MFGKAAEKLRLAVMKFSWRLVDFYAYQVDILPSKYAQMLK